MLVVFDLRSADERRGKEEGTGTGTGVKTPQEGKKRTNFAHILRTLVRMSRCEYENGNIPSHPPLLMSVHA